MAVCFSESVGELFLTDFAVASSVGKQKIETGLRGMQVPIPSSRMKGTTTPSFATSRQQPRHKD